jgi:succinate-acetate transporter protein
MHLDPTSVMLLLRVTARISGILLATSFASLALCRLWPSPLTRWMAANRHRIMLLFVLSHTVHLAGVVTLAGLMPERYFSKQGLAVFIPGGLAYALIYYLAWMALARRKNPDLPDTKMQTFAIYVIWGIFTLSFTTGLKRHAWIYALLASVMWLGFAVRVWAKVTVKTPEKVSLADR